MHYRKGMEAFMIDILYLFLGFAFFATTAALVDWLENLRQEKHK